MVLIIIIVLLVVGFGAYIYLQNNQLSQQQTTVSQASSTQNIRATQTTTTGSTNSSSSTQVVAPISSNSSLSTYDNLGISFQYPVQWGIPSENFYGNGLGSVSFNYASSTGQPFAVFIEQDSNPEGTGLLSETFNQMIARFRANDQYIYQQKDISADGIGGVELFYNSAVTGQPYHVEAYFPFQNGSYVDLGADYQAVPQNIFDSIVSTLKWDSATAFKQDPATGIAVYHNNGIQFNYPVKFNTDYASLNIQTSVQKVDNSKLDNNGCYPVISEETGRQGSSTVLAINGIKFCYSKNGGVGAGHENTDYSYMTIHNGNAYTIDYSVGTSNGCGVYQNSPNPSDPDNQKYNECLDFGKNYDSIVVNPIQQSISTFEFAN